MKSKLFSVLKTIVFLFIGVFFIWWFLRLLTPEQKREVVSSLKNANYWWLILSMAIGLVSHIIRALRWNIIIEPLQSKPKLTDTFAAVAIGYAGNLILPRFGEIARCGVLKKNAGGSFTAYVATVVVERIVDLISFFIIFLIGVYVFFKQLTHQSNQYIDKLEQKYFTQNNLMLLTAAIGLFLILLVFVYYKKDFFSKVKFFKNIFSLLERFKQGVFAIVKIKKWFLFIIYTLLIWLCYFYMTWVCFYSIPETSHLNFDAAFAILSFGTIAVMVIPGGIGAFQTIAANTLFLYAIPYTTGYAMGWLIWLAQIAILLLMGLWSIYYLVVKKHIKLNEISKDTE